MQKLGSAFHVEKIQGAKEPRIIGCLESERPEVALRETKGCVRRGIEKLPLQAFANR
ncbi:hypothetical protein M493_11625 [Geobacillus genomosp. 3]|uniref:Uncharacterized protein n=1 Tax=Geobacillus genomosp. 3 TaxID=1921421 RepID=S5ZQ17_GEOG3|nr:hypothetical protein M493_11625 [Geobacillus genomosp. 3]